MTIEQLQAVFFWCLVVNSGIYAITAIAVLGFRGLICRMHKKMFGLDEVAVMTAMHRYLATYKLLITAFNFAPWLALLIMR